MEKLTLGVLFGSRTCEHEVSIISGLQCVEAAEQAGHNVVPIYISREGLWYTGAPLRDVKTYQPFDPEAKGLTRVLLDTTPGSGELMAWPPVKQGLFGSAAPQAVARIDVMVPVMHGVNGEDGTLQGLFEMADIPYTSSSVLGCAAAMDKTVMKYVLRGAGLPVLQSTWFTRTAWERDPEAVIAQVEAALSYPVYVKPANLGSSIGIGKGADRDSLWEAIQVAVSFDARVLVEQGVGQLTEINCSVLGVGDAMEASVCEMPLPSEAFLSFADKYLAGGKNSGGKSGMQSQVRRIPAPIGEERTARVQQLAKDAFAALAQKGVVRVDMMIDEADGSIYVNEVNAIPGSLAFYLWQEQGLSFAELVDKMVEAALLAQAERRRSVYAYDSKILQGYAAGSKGAKGK